MKTSRSTMIPALAAMAALLSLAACGGPKQPPPIEAPKPADAAPAPAPAATTEAAPAATDAAAGAAAAAPAAAAPHDIDALPIGDEAKSTFKILCSTCHGLSGTGDGIAGAVLNPKPRNWTDPAWQASVDDARLAKVIKEGGPAVGLSVLMAPNPTLKDETIADLVKLVRSFKAAP